MNRQKIISDGELKLLLGNSTASDLLIGMHNKIATNVLCDILQVRDLASHAVVRERPEIIEKNTGIEFRDFPVDAETIVMRNKLKQQVDTDIDYKADSHSDQIFWFVDSEGRETQLIYKTNQVFVDYEAGYIVEQPVTFLANPTDGQKFKVVTLGVETEYTFKTSPAGDLEIQIGGTTTETVENTATALSGSADGEVLYLPVGTQLVSSEASVSFETVDIPEDLKYCVSLIAGGSLANIERAGGVVSYKLGQKTVNFRNQGDAEAARMILDQYISKRTPFIVLA